MPGWESIVPAVSALAGVAMGSLLSGRNERRSWQREKKYEVFQQVTSAARSLLWRGDEIDGKEGDPGLAEQRERVRRAMFELREKLAAVELITKGKTVEAARDLEGHFGNVLYPYFFSVERAEGDAPVVMEARRLLIRFQSAARSELTKE